jgi:hypothetical protein
MRPDEHPAIVKLFEIVMGDDHQPHLPEPVHLHVVVNDVAEAIQGRIVPEFALSNFNGIHHAKAKAGMGINGDLHLIAF